MTGKSLHLYYVTCPIVMHCRLSSFFNPAIWRGGITTVGTFVSISVDWIRSPRYTQTRGGVGIQNAPSVA